MEESSNPRVSEDARRVICLVYSGLHDGNGHKPQFVLSLGKIGLKVTQRTVQKWAKKYRETGAPHGFKNICNCVDQF